MHAGAIFRFRNTHKNLFNLAYGRHVVVGFSVYGPTVWNALPDYLRNPILSIDVFKNFFYLLSINTALQRIRNIVPLRYINSWIDLIWFDLKS